MSWLTPLEKSLDKTGHWSPITSTIYWCEEKYQFSSYIAEFTNTLSNIFFIFLSVYGIYKVKKQNLPKRFILCYLGITLVGIGSFLFHMTLKFNFQLLDELPMLIVSTFLTWSVCETSKGYVGNGMKEEDRKFGRNLAWLFGGGVSLVCGIYVWNRNPVFHQVAYAMIQLISTIRVGILIYSSKSPLAKPSALKARSQIRFTYNLGSVIFLSGFAIWNLDNIFCRDFRKVRHQVGWPVAFLLEGHAWWHLMTGTGAYLLVVASELLVISLKEDPENVILSKGTLIPYAIRIKDHVEGVQKQDIKLEPKVLRNGKKLN